MSLEKKASRGPDTLNKLSKPDIEQRLWQRAEEIAARRTELTAQQENLYNEIEAMRKRNLNLHEKDQVALKEGIYWATAGDLDELTRLDTAVETALRELSGGTLDRSSLVTLLPPQQQGGPMLSKRKQRILEERERIAKLNKEHFILDTTGGAPETRHLTTGRHATGIKGNLNAMDAEAEFFHRTADTHGGKVSHGKDGRSFISKSGKKIRKK